MMNRRGLLIVSCLLLAMLGGSAAPALAARHHHGHHRRHHPHHQARHVRITVRVPRSRRAGGLVTFTGRTQGSATVEIRARLGHSERVLARGRSAKSGRYALTWIARTKAAKLRITAVAIEHGRTVGRSRAGTLKLRKATSGTTAVVVSPKAQVLAAAAVTSAPPSGTAGQVVYAGGNDLKAGQIIAIGAGSATPDGLIAKVTAVRQDGDQTIATTTPAGLEQAVESASIDQTVTGQTQTTEQRRRDVQTLEQATEKAVTCKGSAEASVTASLSVGASIEAKASIGFFSLKSASLTGEAHASASVDLKASASGSCTLEKTTLVTLPGPKAAFSVGPIPVVVTSEIPIYLEASAKADAALETKISGGFTAQAGVGYTKGQGFYPIKSFTPNFSFTPPTLTASASIDASVTPTLEITVDGVAHANIGLKAGLALDADITKNPWWDLTAPVSLTADLDLSVPDLFTLSSPTLTMYSHTFEIANAGGPFGGTSTTPTTPTTPPPTTRTLAIVAGNGTSGDPTEGLATSSELEQPADVVVGPDGSLYITDIGADVIEKINPAGQLSVFAGQVDQSGEPVPGPALGSEFDFGDGDGGCGGLAVDSAGNVYVADCGNNDVEEITPSGQLSILAGIPGESDYPTPGPAADSDLDDPGGIGVDGSGNVYIADSGNDVIEKVTPAHQLSIIAGQLGESGAPTPGSALDSDIGSDCDITADAAGDVYVADFDNEVVEKITPSGQLSIVAGDGDEGTPTAGTATNSALDFGGDNGGGEVAVDRGGNLYIADGGNSAVEEVTPSGQLSVIAGQPGEDGTPTAGAALQTQIGVPTGVSVDAAGNVYVADIENAEILKISAG